jgi:hypothetical protein
VANESKQEFTQVQADGKLIRMAAERLSKIITEGKTATGDDAAKKALNTAAENARKTYSGLSTQITTLEAGVRKVEQACKG